MMSAISSRRCLYGCGAGSVGPPGSFEGWLRRVTRYAFLDDVLLESSVPNRRVICSEG